MTNRQDPIPLPVKLKPSHLRPVAYRVLSKKHGLHVKSDALIILTEYVEEQFGLEWKSPAAIKFLEEVGRAWKSKFQANKNLFIDGDNLKVILSEITEKKYSKQNREVKRAQANVDVLLLQKDNSDKLDGQPMAAKKSDTIVDKEEEVVIRKKLTVHDYFHIKDCYELPVAKYNHLNKRYEPYLAPQDKLQKESLSKRLQINMNVQDNLNLYMLRYYQSYHRILRNESFRFVSAFNPTLSTYYDEILLESAEFEKLRSINEESKQISLIKNLLGRHGKQFIIFGLITKNNEGEYQLQDASDAIVLDLSKVYPAEGYFYFEGCLLICDGIYINFGGKSKFVANLIYHPKPELRKDFFDNFGLVNFQTELLDLMSPKTVQEFDKYNKKLIQDSELQLQMANDDYDLGIVNPEKIVFLGSKVCLDSLTTLDYLKKFFKKITVDLNNLPLAIVFPGSFISKSFEVSSVNNLSDNSSMAFKNLFDSLAIVLSQFPVLCARTQFVFVAGHNDPWNSLVFQGSKSMTMPYNRLPKLFFNRLSKIIKNLKLVTNPFKMFYLNQEICLLNDDIYERMLKNNIPFNYYHEKDQLINSLINENDPLATSEIYIDDDDDDDEESRTAKSLLAKQTSQFKNLSIDSLQRNHLRPSETKTFKQDVSKIVNTLISQSHLSPFAPPIKPVSWKYDQLLSLNPLPNVLVLFDSTIDFFTQEYSGVKVINVGKFINNDNRAANYIEYFPATQRAELKKVYHI